MPRLRNRRREDFARAVAEGEDVLGAYARIFDVGDADGATRSAAALAADPVIGRRALEIASAAPAMAETSDDVGDRTLPAAPNAGSSIDPGAQPPAPVAPPLAPEPVAVTLDSLMAEADGVRRLALEAGRFADAIAAIKVKWQMAQLGDDRREAAAPDLKALSDDELDRIARGGGAGTAAPPAGPEVSD